MKLHNPDNENRSIEAGLIAANFLRARGKPVTVERLYKRLLKQAEKLRGDSSPLAGMVLLELYDFYEQHGRDDEAQPVWERVRLILMDGRERLRNG